MGEKRAPSDAISAAWTERVLCGDVSGAAVFGDVYTERTAQAVRDRLTQLENALAKGDALSADDRRVLSLLCRNVRTWLSADPKPLPRVQRSASGLKSRTSQIANIALRLHSRGITQEAAALKAIGGSRGVTAEAVKKTMQRKLGAATKQARQMLGCAATDKDLRHLILASLAAQADIDDSMAEFRQALRTVPI